MPKKEQDLINSIKKLEIKLTNIEEAAKENTRFFKDKDDKNREKSKCAIFISLLMLVIVGLAVSTVASSSTINLQKQNYTSSVVISSDIEITLYCQPTNTFLFTEKSTIDCYLLDKTTRENKVTLSYDIALIDPISNNSVINLCFRNGNYSITINKNSEENKAKCDELVNEGLGKNGISTRGVGTYYFKIINLNIPNERSRLDATFPKRLNIVSEQDERTLIDSNNNRQLTLMSLYISIVALLFTTLGSIYNMIKDVI